MKFRQETIENPVNVDSNTIQGTVQGRTVKVRRELDGWRVRFVVSIDGISFHNDTATEDEKKAFEALAQRAWDIENTARENKRTELTPVIRALFNLP